MAWGGPPSKPDGEDDRSNKTRYAVPPACPRCELTKGQMNRTIQNYQKAYRKKVEGLKQELSTVRADNQHLRSQVRRLRRKRLLHAPSLLVGAALGALAGRLVQRLWQQKQQQQQDDKPQPQQEQPTASPADGAAAVNGVGSS